VLEISAGGRKFTPLPIPGQHFHAKGSLRAVSQLELADPYRTERGSAGFYDPPATVNDTILKFG
jgi:hypothetical protein